jgi:hypothetical protein
MCSGGIGTKTLVVVAAAMARYADLNTGRSCRPSNAQLAACTSLPVRTVQRARECLRLLGVATEVLRGRQRTYVERMASWRMGDRSRGWASVWALHDVAQVNRVIHTLSPHLGRSHLRTFISSKRVTTTTRGRAKRTRHGATRRNAPDENGQQLAIAWRGSKGVPPWAHRYSVNSWAGMLAAPSAAGWTPRDLTQLVRDWLGVGNRISDRPGRPIALLGTILAWHTSHNTLEDRPAAADEAREAAELAAVQERRAGYARERAVNAEARETGREALQGAGHAWALQEFARLARRGAQRRTEEARRQTLARDAMLRDAREHHGHLDGSQQSRCDEP